MSTFSVTPLTDIPPPAAQDFPNFLQFQEDGTDLGLPDADTLNFSTGITATRGVGENSNVVTVTGGAPVSLLQLDSPPDPPIGEIFLFDGTSFLNFWGDIPQISSDDWEWVTDVEMKLRFLTAGRYRVTTTCFIEAETEWPDGPTTYGSIVGISTATQARFHNTGDLGDTRIRMQWTDQHLLVAEANAEIDVGLFAVATDTTHVVLIAQMLLAIERISDL